jgi:hypothetical protein
LYYPAPSFFLGFVGFVEKELKRVERLKGITAQETVKAKSSHT